TLFPADSGEEGLDLALTQICEAAGQAVEHGATILVLSDRGVDAGRAPVPMLLAVGAVHHHLIRTGKRMRATIIAETAEARDVHQIACLIGFGASAVNPYLAFATLAELAELGDLKDVIAAVTKGMDAEQVAALKKSGDLTMLVREKAFSN